MISNSIVPKERHPERDQRGVIPSRHIERSRSARGAERRAFSLFTIILFILLSAKTLNAQENANTILHKVYSKVQKAKDYSVDVHVKVDMPFIRMMPVNAKIYYKQKDKFKVESKSIAIVPRQGFDQSSKLLADTNSFTTIIQGKEMIGSTQAVIINIIPLSDTSDLILGKLWIDT
ncbi:MAG TPA: hypothetical protein VJI69_07620, partial [Bacteroidia bacterium]|nr:hypothetical protein [Bacteroidia bacterium]